MVERRARCIQICVSIWGWTGSINKASRCPAIGDGNRKRGQSAANFLRINADHPIGQLPQWDQGPHGTQIIFRTRKPESLSEVLQHSPSVVCPPPIVRSPFGCGCSTGAVLPRWEPPRERAAPPNSPSSMASLTVGSRFTISSTSSHVLQPALAQWHPWATGR